MTNTASMDSTIEKTAASKPFVELRPASAARNVANRDRDRPLPANDDHEPLATRSRRMVSARPK
jgi:hypothetical protein